MDDHFQFSFVLTHFLSPHAGNDYKTDMHSFANLETHGLAIGILKAANVLAGWFRISATLLKLAHTYFIKHNYQY
ncbi:hypothetical protein [Undibacterium sp. Ji50W]|uniref:hypothetical protein n=1 Tax=Undibacterium sp. Ji50W TaxID=3413041 RepID=UPI003BF59BF8